MPCACSGEAPPRRWRPRSSTPLRCHATQRHYNIQLAEEFLQFQNTRNYHDECQDTRSACQEVAEGGGYGKEEAHLVIINVRRRSRRVSSVGGKGHCIVYTADGVRFEVPLVLLGTNIFSELLRMSQEEFGFAGVDGGRITLPCDALVMEYAMCLLRRSASAETADAFLNTMEMSCHYHVAPHLGVSQHFGVCSS
uniref:Uncharacterized protein n=1 Tax=Aegilops tauschii subsp. strangulata TaxID=200361 RepID=A0A453LJE1_AEGTS